MCLYVCVYAVYSTTTKVTSDAIGLEGLTKVVAAAKPAPVVAIGGIKAEHIDVSTHNMAQSAASHCCHH